VKGPPAEHPTGTRAAAPREISERHVEILTAADIGGYWWYEVRLAHVREALAPVGRAGDLRYLDFGCGTGGVLSTVVRELRPRLALGLDGTQEAVDVADYFSHMPRPDFPGMANDWPDGHKPKDAR